MGLSGEGVAFPRMPQPNVPVHAEKNCKSLNYELFKDEKESPNIP